MRCVVGVVMGEMKEWREVMSMVLSINDEKRIIGVGGVVFEDVLYLIDWLFDLLVRILV